MLVSVNQFNYAFGADSPVPVQMDRFIARPECVGAMR